MLCIRLDLIQEEGIWLKRGIREFIPALREIIYHDSYSITGGCLSLLGLSHGKSYVSICSVYREGSVDKTTYTLHHIAHFIIKGENGEDGLVFICTLCLQLFSFLINTIDIIQKLGR